MKAAFITGLPRTRTFWFSKYFQAYDIPAHHELLAQVPRETFYEIMDAGAINCDCGLLITDWQDRYPAAPCLTIHRDPRDVFEALKPVHQAMGWDEPDLDILMKYERKLQDNPGIHVDYDDIDRWLPEIHAYLAPGVRYDPGLAEGMMGQNLQVDLTTYKPKTENIDLWVA